LILDFQADREKDRMITEVGEGVRKMGVKIGKPILVSGIGITLVLGLWETFNSKLTEIGEWGMLGAIAVGAGFWFCRRPTLTFKVTRPTPLSREKVEEAIAQTYAIISYLEQEAPEQDLSPLQQEIQALTAGFDRQTLQVAITGARKTGKTTLQQRLEAQNFGETISFVETESLLSIASSETEQKALASDLVLYLLNGDLTDSEWQILQTFARLHQRSILLLGKQDRLPPEEKAEILLALQKRLQDILPADDILAIAAAPDALKVRQHQADGEVKEWTERRDSEIGDLVTHLTHILDNERDELIWGTIWRQAQRVKERGQDLLNQSRRTKAVPIIEQYQWISAATAFANPVAALDLVSAVAINGQMLVDLGGIYQQKLSLSGARATAETIGKLMVQLGVVEVTTQAIGTILKGNAITYLAGGTVQGISAAYLTRLAGLSLIEYFQEQDIVSRSAEDLNWDRLGRKIKQLFEQNQRIAFLQDFVKQSIPRLSESKVAS
jgi:uncharacterized protein (DUF697 family)